MSFPCTLMSFCSADPARYVVLFIQVQPLGVTCNSEPQTSTKDQFQVTDSFFTEYIVFLLVYVSVLLKTNVAVIPHADFVFAFMEYAKALGHKS